MFTRDLPGLTTPGNWPDEIRRRAPKAGLIISLETTLKTLPGSTHIHLKHPGKPGTLEFTYLPHENRAWLSYHENRYQQGMEEAIQNLAE